MVHRLRRQDAKVAAEHEATRDTVAQAVIMIDRRAADRADGS